MTIRTLSMSTPPTKIRTVCFAIFSKHSRFSLITDDEVQRYTALLNFRPKARLGWLTLMKLFFVTLLIVARAAPGFSSSSAIYALTSSRSAEPPATGAAHSCPILMCSSTSSSVSQPFSSPILRPFASYFIRRKVTWVFSLSCISIMTYRPGGFCLANSSSRAGRP